jgi:hypothetical protein
MRSGLRVPGRHDPVVEPGDIVIMPRIAVKWWQDYVTIASAVAVPIASLLVTIALTR